MLPVMTANSALIDRLERYYDAVPRSRAGTEQIGPFTLFVARSGWPYYARPVLQGRQEIRPDDVRRVLDRQRELNVPRAMEWVDEVTPRLAETVESVGVSVARCPLLVLDGEPKAAAGCARMLTADEPDVVAAARAAIGVGFAHAGTATGPAGLAARDAELGSNHQQVSDELVMSLVTGAVRMAAAFAPEEGELGPVGGGSYWPVEDVAEIVGVAVLPAYRRRGLAAQITSALASDAYERGVSTVFCSAQSDEVARVYEAVGFRRVGTACIAEAPSLVAHQPI